MGKPSTSPIYLNGVQVGTVTAGESEDVSPFPLGEGNAFGPAPSLSVFPRTASREMPSRDYSPGPGHHAAPSHAPHRHLGGAHPRHDELSSTAISPNQIGSTPSAATSMLFHHPDYGDESKSRRRTPEEVGKHPGLCWTAEGRIDIRKSARLGDGVIDRAHWREYLKTHPELREKIPSPSWYGQNKVYQLLSTRHAGRSRGNNSTAQTLEAIR